MLYHPGSSRSQSEEKTFPSLNQTGESSSSDLNLGHSPLTFPTQPSKSRVCVGGCAFLAMVFRGPYHHKPRTSQDKSSTSKAKDQTRPRQAPSQGQARTSQAPGKAKDQTRPRQATSQGQDRLTEEQVNIIHHLSPRILQVPN